MSRHQFFTNTSCFLPKSKTVTVLCWIPIPISLDKRTERRWLPLIVDLWMKLMLEVDHRARLLVREVNKLYPGIDRKYD